MEWGKEVKLTDGFAPSFDLGAAKRVGPPRKLARLTRSTVQAAYEPLPTALLKEMLGKLQDITFKFEEPFFLMSGVGMVYRVTAPPVRVKGCLSDCRPGVTTEGEFPTMTMTFTPTED